jgi:hypothetical protein
MWNVCEKREMNTGFGGEIGRKEKTWKTSAQMGARY